MSLSVSINPVWEGRAPVCSQQLPTLRSSYMLILIFLVSLCVCLLGQHRSCRHLPWAADGSKHARQREALVSGVLCVQQSIVDHSPITWSSLAVPCFCEWETLPFALGAGCIGVCFSQRNCRFLSILYSVNSKVRRLAGCKVGLTVSWVYR